MPNVPTNPPRGMQKCKFCEAVGPPCRVCQGTGEGHSPCASCKGTGLEVHATIIPSCKGAPGGG
jgi:hypothetical protein